MFRHSQTPRRGTFWLLVLAVSVLLLGLSVVLLSIGLRPTSESAAPLPPRTFNIPAATRIAYLHAAPTSPDPSHVNGTRSLALPERSSAPLNHHLPTHLLANHRYLPSLEVDALDQPITPAAGTLTPPSWPQTVGLDTRAGQLDVRTGTVLMTSHLNYVGRGQAAFADLYFIGPLAQVVVTAATGVRRLALATCGGTVTNGDDARKILAYVVPVG